MTEELHSKVWNQSNRNYFAREREITHLRNNICFFLPETQDPPGWMGTHMYKRIVKTKDSQTKSERLH